MRAPAAVFLVAFLGLLLQAASLSRLQASPVSPRQQQQQGVGDGGTAREEKVRLGSSPPNCRGKCYECSPCTAVQVPTMSAAPSGPSAAAASARARLRPASSAAGVVASLSNYKPIGWKCQCGSRVYEP